MNRKLYLFGFALMLMLISFVSAANVAYIYRADSKIDSNVVDVFTEMGLETYFVNENNLSGLSQYNFIYVGDESFTKTIPIYDYNSIVANYYLGKKSGITDNDGTSKLVSKHNLNVNIEGKLIEVYNEYVDNRGIAIPYYFLDDDNKASGFKRYAGTDTTSSGNPFGDVISFGEKGLTLENGEISKGNICFFGIVKSQYWTAESRDLLKECVNFVNKLDVPNEPVVCNNDSQCNDNNPKTIDKCLNSGTSSSSCSHSIVICNNNLDCGTNAFIGNPSCSLNNVFQSFISFSCNNPGTADSYCTNETQLQFIKNCSSCLNGICQDIQCSKNSDCDDGNSSTEDVCVNSGTVNSVCFYNLPGKVKLVSLVAVPTETSVQLSFSAIPGNGSGLNGYWLSMNRNDSLWTLTNDYTFNGLSPSTLYTFYVKAVDNSNQTSEEVNVSVTTLASSSPVVSSGGSGSSGGNGQGNGLCITQWQCGDWGKCTGSQQTRTCSYPANYCYPTASKPIERQSCVEVQATGDLGAASENNTDTNSNGRLAPITGAVIGVIGDHPLWFILGFLALIAVIYAVLRFRK